MTQHEAEPQAAPLTPRCGGELTMPDDDTVTARLAAMRERSEKATEMAAEIAACRELWDRSEPKS